MRRIALFLVLILIVSALSSCDIPSNSSDAEKIKMPNSTEYYIGSEWTLDTLTEHLNELGFTNIRPIPCKPDDNNYKNNILEMYIQTGAFSTDPWKAGDEYKADAKIEIYYNEAPMLTVDNCPDLKVALYSTDLDFKTFITEYDGKYVEFDAYIYEHTSSYIEHIIDVAAGDGSTEGATGWIVRIGDRTLGHNIDTSVMKGDLVKVSGRIDASWSEFYNKLYVECLVLNKRY